MSFLRSRSQLWSSRVVAALVIGLAGAAPAGQAAQAPLPTGAELIARHVAAIGGEAAFKGIKSMRVRGRFELTAQAIGGDLEILTARPNRMLQRIDIPNVGRAETGYDGKIGWSIDPQAGPSLLTGRELSELVDDAWFDGPLHAADHVREISGVERVTFDQRAAYKAKVILTSGSDQVEYFDAETGWQIGMEGNRATSMGVLPTTTILRDYKKFGNLSMPTTLIQRAIGIESALRVTSCEYDVVTSSAFDIPPQVKALIK